GQADEPPQCRWCGSAYPHWRCAECGYAALRAMAVGVGRTAEELGRAFAGATVLMSRGEAVRSSVGSEPALVVATPGAEPLADGGYAAAVLLDGTALLTRPSLRAGEEALRRWLRAAALVRPGPDGGSIVVVAEPSAPAVQAFVRWDPAGALGPAPGDDGVRVVVRAPRASGTALAAALRAAAGVRSARRSGGSVRVRIDPVDLG